MKTFDREELLGQRLVRPSLIGLVLVELINQLHFEVYATGEGMHKGVDH